MTRTFMIVVQMVCLLCAATGLFGCNVVGTIQAEFAKPPTHGIADRDLPADVAWELMAGREKTNARLRSVFESKAEGDAWWLEESAKKRELAQKLAEQKGIPSQSFDQIVSTLSERLAIALPAFAEKKFKGSGSGQVKIALAVGRFKDSTNLNEPELRSALKAAAARLNRNAAFTKYVDIIQYSMEDANSMIKEIGGGTDDWLRPDESNSVMIETKTYHPDLIYVLEGELFYKDRQLPNLYEKTFTSTVAITHPRTRKQVEDMNNDFKQVYVYHPYRMEWISDVVNDELKTKYALAASK